MVCSCVNELTRLLSGGSCTTLMTYSFVTQPASSTSCAHYTRRLTNWRPRGTVGCATGSQRLGNASTFSSAGVPHSGNTRELKYGRQSVAENPFSRTEEPMACTRHVVLLARFSATGRNVCAQLLRAMASNVSDVPPGAAELSVMRPSDVWSRLATHATQAQHHG